MRAAARAAEASDPVARQPGARATQAAARHWLRSHAAPLSEALTQALRARLSADSAPPVDPGLEMLDAATVDESIAVARLMHAVESGGMAAPGLPLRMAAGLRDGLEAQVADAELRLVLLGLLADAFTGAAAPAAPGRPVLPGSRPPLLADLLARLVVQAHARRAGSLRSAAEAQAAPALPLLEPGVSAPLIEELVAAVEASIDGLPAVAAALDALRGPARLLAAREPQLWMEPGHPWWSLLDRLLAVAAVHDDGTPTGPVRQGLLQALQRLQQAGPLDAGSCRAAADALERVAVRRLQERRLRLGPPARTLEAQADLQELQLALRDQIVVQLRSTPTSAPLRRFLVGPWALVMAHAARSHGLNAPELDGLALQVDALIRATRRPGRPVALALRIALLGIAREALATAGFSEAQAEAEVALLEAVLRDPPPPEDAPPPSAAETRADTMDLPAPTRMSTLIDLDAALEVAGHARWLDALQPGDCVRLFLHDRWTTLQLVWVSAPHHLFVFDGRPGQGTPALSRRLLARLRTAGLAVPVDEGGLLAMAARPLLAADRGAM